MVRRQQKEAMMANVRTEEVTLDVDGRSMPAFLALPESAGPHAAVLVFEEVFGVNVHIRDVARRLAAEGYVAIAPDYHHRAWTPGTQLGYTEADVKRGMEVIPKLTADGMSADIAATIAYLRTRKEVDPERLGAIGFCIGGHAAYFCAATQPVKATASFYGGGIASFGPGGGPPTVQRTGGIKGKILCLFGKKDAMIPQDQVQTIRQALEEHHVRHEIIVYDDATHGFFCDQRGSYEPKAAADAWERVKRFFGEELSA
jgi:carboxymethylenebutenolidase